MIHDILPLSPLQEGILFDSLFDTEAVDFYQTQFVIELAGDLDAARMRRALQALIDRHDNLRVSFRHQALRKPVQVVPHSAVLPWREEDLAGLDGEQRVGRRKALLAADREERFDPAVPPLLRALYLREAADRHCLVLTCHHLLIDGWSVPILLREVLALYHGVEELQEGTAYRDYLKWLGEQDRDAAIAAWRGALRDLPGATLLTSARRERAAAMPEQYFRRIPEDLERGIATLARAHAVTANTVFQTAWALVLGGCVGSDDVTFGATVSARPPQLPGVESMIGFFINTVPVRVRWDGGQPVGAVLRQLQEEQALLREHLQLGLTEIQELAGRGTLFDTLLVFQNSPFDDAWARDPDGPRVTGLSGQNATYYPVTVVVRTGNEPTVRMDFRQDVIDRQRAEELTDRLFVALRQLTMAGDGPAGHVDVFGPEQRDRQLAFVQGPRESVEESTLAELFEAQVRRSPDATALVTDEGRWTYQELNARAEEIADGLVLLGAGPERLVALALPSSADLIAAMLGVAKSGAAYLPLDLAQPDSRIADIMGDAAPMCLVTSGDQRAEADSFAPAGVPVLVIDDPARPVSSDGVRPERTAASSHNQAYVLYTSGSTGRPKGVSVEHASLANYLAWTRRAYPEARDSVLLPTSLSFDLSVTGLYTPLISGGTLYVAKLEVLEAEHADWRPCTFLKGTPSHLPLLLEVPERHNPRGRLILGGERLTAEALEAWRVRHPRAMVVNAYGPTEATVNVSQFEVPPGAMLPPGPVPIGRPLHNTRLYVLDSTLRPVPPSISGELYIAGAPLARGYLGRSTLTAERFVADPLGTAGERMYRTGDLARWTEDGQLEFLGRVDEQINLRGFRIESAEVESALRGCPGVAQAAVAVHVDEHGDSILVGYAVADGGAELASSEVREYLTTLLPHYMVPGKIVVLDALPLTGHGKLDRSRLPAPEESAGTRGRGPRNPTEELLCDLFAEALGAPHFGVDEDFFESGGQSLLALRLVGKIRSALGIRLPVRSVFDHPTIAGLMDAIDGGDAESAFTGLLPLRAHGRRPPLFCVHDSSGLSWCYGGLRKHLHAEQPLFGIQAPTMSDHEFGGIGELADEYAALIRTVQPSGPYHLLGWSVGGLIAQAMATRLQQAGESVGALVLMDTSATRDVTGAPRDPRQTAELILARDGAYESLDEDTRSTVRRTIVRHAEAAERHVPEIFRGDVLYFSATQAGPPVEVRPIDTWSPYIDGKIVEEVLDCGHLEMTGPDSLARIARSLNELLRP